ncbi:MAG: hypothetical protein AAGA48_21860 [Myxococcota bacterium]
MASRGDTPLKPESIEEWQARGLPPFARELLGPIVHYPESAWGLWRCGFLHTLVLNSGYAEAPDCIPPSFVDQLLAHPTAALLECLEFPVASRAHWQADLDSIVHQGPLRAVRDLRVGPATGGAAIPHAVVGNLARVWSQLPHLEQVSICGREGQLGRVVAPRLRTLRCVVEPDVKGLAKLTPKACPQLRSVVLEAQRLASDDDDEFYRIWWRGMPRRWAFEVLPALGGLSLTSLALRGTADTAALLRALAATPLTQTLTFLDLSEGDLEQPPEVLDVLAAFPALQQLVLNHQPIAQQAPALTAALPKVTIEAEVAPGWVAEE